MSTPIAQSQRQAAKTPHELFMVNLGAHLLLGPLVIFLGLGRLGLLVPVALSGLFIAYNVSRLQRFGADMSAFVKAHWRQALQRYRLLLIAYALSALLLGGAWLLGLAIEADSPQKFLPLALTRIGVMPTLVMVLVCLVLENSALGQALRGEWPDRRAVSSTP